MFTNEVDKAIYVTLGLDSDSEEIYVGVSFFATNCIFEDYAKKRLQDRLEGYIPSKIYGDVLKSHEVEDIERNAYITIKKVEHEDYIELKLSDMYVDNIVLNSDINKEVILKFVETDKRYYISDTSMDNSYVLYFKDKKMIFEDMIDRLYNKKKVVVHTNM